MIWHIAGNSGRNGSFGWTFGYAILERFPATGQLLVVANQGEVDDLLASLGF